MEGDCLLAQLCLLRGPPWWSRVSLLNLLNSFWLDLNAGSTMCEETSSSLFADASRAYRQREGADGSADLFVPFIWPE